MPASSRKRNKGKDRKAKQLVKKEENERARANMFWRRVRVGTDCDHGCALIPDDHLSSFMDQFYINLHHKGMTVSQNLRSIFQTHTQILTNESYRRLVIVILIRIGTNMLLSNGRYDMANALCVEQSIVVLEHYNETKDDIDSVMNERGPRSKSRDICSGSTSAERDLLKFFRKRTSCKCLKKMHLEARKSTPKMGKCMNCNKQKERVALSVCSECMVTQYCSRKCQVADWPEHKSECDIMSVLI